MAKSEIETLKLNMVRAWRHRAPSPTVADQQDLKPLIGCQLTHTPDPNPTNIPFTNSNAAQGAATIDR